MPIRVVLADDHILVRQGLKTVLEREGFEIVADAADGQEACKLCEKLHPDVAVLDISMPQLNGIDATRKITRLQPRTRVILLTMYSEERFVLESLRAGASGYLLKTNASAELVQAIREVWQGRTYLSPGFSRSLLDKAKAGLDDAVDPLSERERQVLQLIAEGNSSKEIAHLLGISARTAESHRTRMMEKLKIRDTAGLVRYAVSRGLIEV